MDSSDRPQYYLGVVIYFNQKIIRPFYSLSGRSIEGFDCRNYSDAHRNIKIQTFPEETFEMAYFSGVYRKFHSDVLISYC